jgi:hypothetical protein
VGRFAQTQLELNETVDLARDAKIVVDRWLQHAVWSKNSADAEQLIAICLGHTGLVRI